MTHPAPSAEELQEIKKYIREVPDFPAQGVSFKDITPLMENGPAFHAAVEALALATEHVQHSHILCAEARGFVFGTALAYRAVKGLILARKPDKLPRETNAASYDLEYGSTTLEVHADAIHRDTRILVVDDLLATGGTASAMCQLVENAGGVVAATAFLVELAYLGGRGRLAPHTIISLLTYEAE